MTEKCLGYKEMAFSQMQMLLELERSAILEYYHGVGVSSWPTALIDIVSSVRHCDASSFNLQGTMPNATIRGVLGLLG